MTAESIRYYERMGIILPEKNPVSGYRYYSAWDVNMLVKARQYRQQGFSMEETVELMKKFEPVRTIETLSRKEDELRQQILELMAVMAQVHDEQEIIADAQSGRNNFTLQYRPPMHFLQTQVGYDLFMSNYEFTSTWLQKYAAFILPGGIYEGPGVNDVSYGMFVDDSKLETVGYKNEPEVRALPSCLCLTSSFLSGSDLELKYESFQSALDYIDAHNMKIIGEPVSRIVLMTRSGDMTYRSLHKLWIPIEGENLDLPTDFTRFADLSSRFFSQNK